MSTIYDDVARDARDDYRHDPRPFERTVAWSTAKHVTDIRDLGDMPTDERRMLLEGYGDRVWLDDLVDMYFEDENLTTDITTTYEDMTYDIDVEPTWQNQPRPEHLA